MPGRLSASAGSGRAQGSWESIYLAGPMSGLPDHNVPAFDSAAAQLRERGFFVVSPPEITRANPQPGIRSDGSIDEAAYRELVRLDLRGLLGCSAVAVLPGWEKSKGARLEVSVAKAIGLSVYWAADLIQSLGAAAPLDVVVMYSACVGLPNVGAVGRVPKELDCAGGAACDGDPSRVVVGQAAV
jgi:hypothetical protein